MFVAHIDMANVSSIADPNAWAKKYLMHPSVSWFVFDCIRIGMNLRRFSSMAAHKNSQFVLEIAIIVLIISVDEVSIEAGVHKYLIRLWRN